MLNYFLLFDPVTKRMTRVRLLSGPRKFSDRVAHSLQELDRLYKERSRQSTQPPTPQQIIEFFAEHTPYPPPGEDRDDD